MLAGYRDEEIAQPRRPSNRRRRPMTTRRTSMPASRDYGKAVRFPLTIWKMPGHHAIRPGDAEIRQDKLSQYRTGNRPQDIAQAKASLEQAQAQLAQAELDLHDTTLVAPSDGTLMTRAVEPGSMLSAGSTVLTLSLTRPVWVRAYIDEPNLGQMQPGRELLLYTDGRPDKPYHGKVGFVSPTAEFTPKTVETPDLRTDLVYRLRIIVTDADDALRQGMPVTVKVNNGERHE